MVSLMRIWGQSWPEPRAIQIGFDAQQSRIAASILRVVALAVAGAAPILAIPAYVSGLVDLHDAARFLVTPMGLIAVGLALGHSREAAWAMRGMLAGLLAVTAYDALRMPLVYFDIWPDFIPRLGGWIVGSDDPHVVVGYLWRYIGDGGGIGLVFFLACAIAGFRRGTPLGRHSVALGIGYGVFVWSGLIGTVLLLDAGPAMLFELTFTSVSLSLLGHLIYGSILGLCYRWSINQEPAEPNKRPAGELVDSGHSSESALSRADP